jgi:hypothetical protein
MWRLSVLHRLGAGTCAGVAAAVYASQRATAEPGPTPSAAVLGASDYQSTLLGRVAGMEKALLHGREDTKFVVVSPTFYPNKSDTRFQLGLEACRRAKALRIPLLLVDASPPEVKEELRAAGATVHDQTWTGRKGAALREAIDLARASLPPDGVICFQELEKVEMIGLQREVASYITSSGCDVCVPRREDSLFRRSYPVEQYHQETFANLYLDALGAAVGLPSLDWTFGRPSTARLLSHCHSRCSHACQRFSRLMRVVLRVG